MTLASFTMAISVLLGGKLAPLNLVVIALLSFASIASVFKSNYVQYSYYLVSFLWFVSLVFISYSGYKTFGTLIISAFATLLPAVLIPVLLSFLLGLISRAFFYKAIQNQKLMIIVKVTIALTIACLIMMIFLYTTAFRPNLLGFVKDFKDNKLAIYSLILIDGLIWVLVAQALPMLVITSFMKNWSKWQAFVTAFFVSFIFLLIVDRNGSFLTLAPAINKVNLAQFFISIAMLYSTYFVARKFVNNKFSIGFD